MAVWIPCDTLSNADLPADTEEGITAASISAITVGSSVVTRGALAGVQLLYAVIFTMTTANVGSACHATDMLETPMPFFETPYFTQRSGAGAATLATTVTFMIKGID